MKEKLISALGIFLSFLFAYFMYNFLPDTVAVQVAYDGTASQTLPKLVVLIGTFLVSIFGSIMYYFAKTDNKKYLLISFVGIMGSVLTLILNH